MKGKRMEERKIEEIITKKVLNANKIYRDDAFVNAISLETRSSKTEVKRIIRNMLSKDDLAVDVENVLSVPVKIFYSAPEKNLLKGKITASSKATFFVQEKTGEKFFVPEYNLNGAMNRDKVLVSIVDEEVEEDELPVVWVEEIVERGYQTVVGTYYEGKSYAFVEPDDTKLKSKIILERGMSSIGAKPGDKVYVKLVSYPRFQGEFFTGTVVENLGPSDSMQAMVLSIVRAHEIVEEFPQDVMDYVKTLKPPTEADFKNRTDFRNIKTFTIDGADARDLDDAVSITRLENGNVQLGVHIADVSEYIKPGSPLDKEAHRRGTSVYFPAPDNTENSKIRGVIPMLPEALSNDLCSLNPHTDKLTLSCMMELDEEGNVVEGENTFVCESVINTCHRLTYDQVMNLFEGDEQVAKELSDIKDDLLLMREYSNMMGKNYKKIGTLDLDLPEPKFIFDENDNVIDVVERQQDESHKLIEHFMIAANITIAKMFKQLKIPFIYRVHRQPDDVKMNVALNVANNVLDNKIPKPPKTITKSYLKLFINATKGEDKVLDQAINSMVLRAMPKAVYSPVCEGHFATGHKFYCHFTSPIRRDEDRTDHRIIKDYLHGRLDEKAIMKYKSLVRDTAETASQTEQNADKTEREVDDLWCCNFMRNKIGEEFEVVVCDVKKYGAYVKIPNTAIEGLIRIEDMPEDRYIYNEERRILMGKNSKFMIGDKVKVRLQSVDMYKREIDYSYVRSLNKEGDFEKFKAKNQRITGIPVYKRNEDGMIEVPQKSHPGKLVQRSKKSGRKSTKKQGSRSR